jgi:hypothetical protein
MLLTLRGFAQGVSSFHKVRISGSTIATQLLMHLITSLNTDYLVALELTTLFFVCVVHCGMTLSNCRIH